MPEADQNSLAIPTIKAKDLTAAGALSHLAVLGVIVFTWLTLAVFALAAPFVLLISAVVGLIPRNRNQSGWRITGLA